MSVSPAQNFSKPPPVPEVPTVTLTSGFSALNCSAIASDSGPTVLEPSTRISPDRLPPLPPSSSSSPPQAATPKARIADAASANHSFLGILESPSFWSWSSARDSHREPSGSCYRRVVGLQKGCEPAVNQAASRREPSGLGGESVADAGVGVNETAARQRALELGAQPADVDVDRAIALPVGAAPDSLIELVAGHHPLGVVRELGEQLELADGERQGPTVDQCCMVGGPDLKPAGVYRGEVPFGEADRRASPSAVLAIHGVGASRLPREKSLPSSELPVNVA